MLGVSFSQLIGIMRIIFILSSHYILYPEGIEISKTCLLASRAHNPNR